MFDLEGKYALITGASGGIGGAIATALHARGATVTLSGTRTGPLEDLRDVLGERTHVMPLNLMDAQAVDTFPAAVEKEMGGLDILVNNAGITKDNLMMRMKDEEWADVIRVNLDSTFRMIRGSLRGMVRRRWGRIISISSISGTMGNPGQTNYAASKAGMIGMSKALAYEVATRGITVNTIAPGFIRTAMTDEISDSHKEKMFAAIPMARFGEVEEIAASVVFLASPEAGFITGQTIHVNGGMQMV